MRLDVSVAYALGMNVRQRSEQLIDIQLDFKYRHGCLHLVEETGCPVYGFGNEFLDKVEIDLIFLLKKDAFSVKILMRGSKENILGHHWNNRTPLTARYWGVGQCA